MTNTGAVRIFVSEWSGLYTVCVHKRLKSLCQKRDLLYWKTKSSNLNSAWLFFWKARNEMVSALRTAKKNFYAISPPLFAHLGSPSLLIIPSNPIANVSLSTWKMVLSPPTRLRASVTCWTRVSFQPFLLFLLFPPKLPQLKNSPDLTPSVAPARMSANFLTHCHLRQWQVPTGSQAKC